MDDPTLLRAFMGVRDMSRDVHVWSTLMCVPHNRGWTARGVKNDYQCWDWWNDHICLGGRISENVRGQGAVLGVLVNNSNQESMVYSLAYDSFIIE